MSDRNTGQALIDDAALLLDAKGVNQACRQSQRALRKWLSDYTRHAYDQCTPDDMVRWVSTVVDGRRKALVRMALSPRHSRLTPGNRCGDPAPLRFATTPGLPATRYTGLHYMTLGGWRQLDPLHTLRHLSAPRSLPDPLAAPGAQSVPARQSRPDCAR